MAQLAYDAPWTALHAAYFASEAWWTYLTAPFLFTHPGFRVREVEPFVEDGIAYRTLAVTFPDDVDSHTTEQFFHFDDTGLLFRHTYTVDILDGATGANYPQRVANRRRYRGAHRAPHLRLRRGPREDSRSGAGVTRHLRVALPLSAA